MLIKFLCPAASAEISVLAARFLGVFLLLFFSFFFFHLYGITIVVLSNDYRL